MHGEARLSGRHLLNLKYLLQACSAVGTEDAAVEKELSSVGLGGKAGGEGVIACNLSRNRGKHHFLQLGSGSQLLLLLAFSRTFQPGWMAQWLFTGGEGNRR